MDHFVGQVYISGGRDGHGRSFKPESEVSFLQIVVCLLVASPGFASHWPSISHFVFEIKQCYILLSSSNRLSKPRKFLPGGNAQKCRKFKKICAAQ